MFNCSETRKYVKENISGKTGTIFGYAVLVYIFKGLISGFLSSFDGVLGYFLPVIIAAVTTPIQVGLFRIVTNILKGQKVSFGMLFDDYKYFVNLFVIGLVCNLVIQLGYKLYIVGLLLDCIYVGILYFFIYNSNLSLGDFFSKAFDKVKEYFPACVLLELSYSWPIFLATFIYIAVAVIVVIATAAANIDRITSISTVEDLMPFLTAIIPLVVISIVFFIVLLVLTIILVPRILFAEAKFYSAFGDGVVKPNQPNKQPNQQNQQGGFCPNCGSKVNGNFCTNCGNKLG